MNGPIGACRRKLAPLSLCARTPYQTIRSAFVMLRRSARERTRSLVGTCHVGSFDKSDIVSPVVGLPPPYPPPQAGEGERLCLRQASLWRGGASRAQPSGERREVERAEAVVGEPAHVGL